MHRKERNEQSSNIENTIYFEPDSSFQWHRLLRRTFQL